VIDDQASTRQLLDIEMFDDVEWPEHDDGTRVGLQVYGHSREEYIRADGEWSIARPRRERLRVDPLGALPSLPG
jgi:hypothetical protein